MDTPKPTIKKAKGGKYVIPIKGGYQLPKGVAPKLGCTGEILFTMKKAKTLISARSTKLNAGCKYAKSFSVAKSKIGSAAKTVGITIRFAGNAWLAPVNKDLPGARCRRASCTPFAGTFTTGERGSRAQDVVPPTPGVQTHEDSLVGAATAAALAAGALATTGVFGSSHREAPRIMLDPAADNTDLYAFIAPDAPGKLTIVSNWVPLLSPAGGPYFGKLDPAAHYYVKIDNTGDGVEDVAYRWGFKNTFRNPDSFLYAVPPVNSFSDRNLNFVQTYDLYYVLYRDGKQVSIARSRKQPPGRARQRRPEDVPELRGRRRRHDPQPARTAARRSSARPTTRSSSTSPPSSTASTSTSPAGR